MATFVTTVKFTEQGTKDIKSTCKRAEAFQGIAQDMGVNIKTLLWTLGPNDGLLVYDAPDEDTATALMLRLSSAGNVRTETARAYAADEMEKVLSKLSG